MKAIRQSRITFCMSSFVFLSVDNGAWKLYLISILPCRDDGYKISDCKHKAAFIELVTDDAHYY